MAGFQEVCFSFCGGQERTQAHHGHACSITQIRLERLSRAILPFLLAAVAVLLLCTYWEALVMAVPKYFGYKAVIP
jgi:hypothetical protein